jgi:hypothetical protein
MAAETAALKAQAWAPRAAVPSAVGPLAIRLASALASSALASASLVLLNEASRTTSALAAALSVRPDCRAGRQAPGG